MKLIKIIFFSVCFTSKRQHQGYKYKLVNLALMLCVCVSSIAAATHDFGVSDSHKPVSHTFVVRNEGEKPFAVVSAKASCACLTVEYATDVIVSGEALSVILKMDMNGLEGKIEKTVTLTKDTGLPVALTMKGVAKTRVGLKPRDVAFGVVKENTRLEPVTVKLHGYATDAVITEISGVDNPIIPVAIGKDKRSLVVTPPEKLPNGMLSEVWTVKMTDPEVPELKLPISVTYSADVEVLPERITLNTNTAVASRSVLLRPAQNKPPFKVLTAETAPRQWGDVEIRERPLGGWQVLVTNIDTDFVRQMSRQPFLKITTDCTGHELLEVPVRMEENQ